MTTGEPTRGRHGRVSSRRAERAVALAIVTALGLTGCIPGVTVREGFGDLRLLSERNGTALDVVGEPYIKGRLGDLTFETTVRDVLHARLGTELPAGATSFDVVALDGEWLAEFGGALAPLDSLYTAEVRADLFPGVLDQARVGNRYVGMPLWTDSEILFYRTDLFEDASEQAAFEEVYGYPLAPPADWAEYRDVAEFFTRDTDGDGRTDLYGTDLKGADPTDWLATVMQAGAEATVLDGDVVTVNDAEHLAALDFYRSLAPFAPRGAAFLDPAGARILFLQGSLAMMRFRASAYPQLPLSSPVSGRVGVAPLIAGPGGIAGVPHALYISVPAAARNGASARDFVVASFEANDRLMTTPPRLPARISVFQAYAAEQGFEHYAALLETLGSHASRPHPPTPLWQPIVDRVLVPLLQRALEGAADSQTLLDEAKAQIEAMLPATAGD